MVSWASVEHCLKPTGVIFWILYTFVTCRKHYATVYQDAYKDSDTRFGLPDTGYLWERGERNGTGQ